jgi:4-alpha-glucanotransferase
VIDARAWGVAPGYHDQRGSWVETAPETARYFLEVMEAREDVPSASPVRFFSPGQEPDLHDAVELELEDGSTIPLLPERPDEIPFGYHRLRLTDGTAAPLVVSPGRCFLPEDMTMWSWAVQLYALRSSESWGIGDFGDLARLGRWARGLGARALLLNPLHAANPGHPRASPYFPSSRRFRDPIYLRPRGPRPPAATALNSNSFIRRGEIYEIKMKALFDEWLASENVDANASADLEDFATYMAIAETHEGTWRGWPEALAHPRAAGIERFRESNRDRISFHVWLQQRIDDQLAEASNQVGLIHDLAVGCDRDGADSWIWQDVFAQGVTTGAPPDPFSPSGQDWGLPPFDPWKLRAAAYEPFIKMMRATLRNGVGARIDHVMGLFRLFWVPEGGTPSDGAYVEYPHQDLLDLVALESHRAGAFVIGEDLGTVEDRVREEMNEREMLSYRVMWFEDDPPEQFPRHAFGTVTNHDLPTIAGLWTGEDERERKSLGLEVDPGADEEMRARLLRATGVEEGAPEELVIERTYEALGRAPSAIVNATLEDALQVRSRPNLPGTSEELRPNWSKPLPAPLEDLERDPLAHRIARSLRARHEEGRVHGFAPLKEGALHYVEAGEGPLVVLLHGFPDFWYSWREQIEPLALAGFRVVAPDMRGYNESFAPEDVRDYTIDHLIDDVVGLIHHLGESRATVVGHDWGAIVAWFLAMDRPEIVERLGIINVPHPATFLSAARDPLQLLKSWYITFFQLPWLPERFLSAGDHTVIRTMFRHASKRVGAFTEDDIELYVGAARRSGNLRGPINYYRAYVRNEPLARTRRISPIEAPVLILWGEEDFAISKKLAEPPHRWVPNAELVRFPDCGHWVHIDRPAEVNVRLIDFARS